MVFHWLQEGHLPSHFADSYPQLWQKYADFALANFLKFYAVNLNQFARFMG
jgi:hypothetical protein